MHIMHSKQYSKFASLLSTWQTYKLLESLVKQTSTSNEDSGGSRKIFLEKSVYDTVKSMFNLLLLIIAWEIPHMDLFHSDIPRRYKIIGIFWVFSCIYCISYNSNRDAHI